MSSTRVWLIGGTGLVGRGVARLMRAREDAAFRSYVRRESGRGKEIMIDFEALPELEGVAEGCDVAISCLGSTIGKAGSWEAFRKVDTGYVLKFAKAARRAGAGQFIHVSSVGAAVGAANKYLRMKGETERGLEEIGFARLDILRPGLLLGARREFRPAERAGMWILPLLRPFLRGAWRRYRAVDAEKVAASIAALVGRAGEGRHVHFNPDIERLAR